MFLYIDESGSINNTFDDNNDFIICMVLAKDKKKLKRVYKRYVSSRFDRLKSLGGKMFINGRFEELKGSQFDRQTKKDFVDFFARNSDLFELFFIRIHNSKLSDKFCSNTSRAFNYVIRLSLDYYINHGFLPKEGCILQLDERNERTETRFFLENYLNTELSINNKADDFTVQYYDSSNNNLIQIADVFANLYYSNIITHGKYEKEIKLMQEKGIIKHIFDFPLD